MAGAVKVETQPLSLSLGLKLQEKIQDLENKRCILVTQISFAQSKVYTLENQSFIGDLKKDIFANLRSQDVLRQCFINLGGTKALNNGGTPPVSNNDDNNNNDVKRNNDDNNLQLKVPTLNLLNNQNGDDSDDDDLPRSNVLNSFNVSDKNEQTLLKELAFYSKMYETKHPQIPTKLLQSIARAAKIEASKLSTDSQYSSIMNEIYKKICFLILKIQKIDGVLHFAAQFSNSVVTTKYAAFSLADYPNCTFSQIEETKQFIKGNNFIFNLLNQSFVNLFIEKL